MPRDPIKCWEYFHCNLRRCPAHRSDDVRCWLLSGKVLRTLSDGECMDKPERCLSCAVLKANMDASDVDGLLDAMRKRFHEFRKERESRDRETRVAREAVDLGLAEVFEALTRISRGDPSARVSEASNVELIRKLKRMVNATAENLGEIVDLSHEFAIGLAEHFDVLHRVSSGDLSARIAGFSEVELLEALKTVTNQTIDSVEREITERQQTEASLRESETRFRTFAEKAPTGITIMRRSLTFEYINPTFTEIFGYTIDDVPDKNTWFRKAYPDEAVQARVIGIWDKECGEGTDPGEIKPRTFRVRCKDGRDKTINFRTVVLPDGKHFVTYSDITEQARAQRAIRQSEEKYRILIDSIQDGVFINQDGVIRFANGALARMVGCTPEEMMGEEILRFVAPEDRSRVGDHHRRRLRGEEVEREYEFRMLHKDGATRVEVNINVDASTYRNRPATIGTVKNITQQKRAEEEKKKLEARLQRSQKMEAIGALAGGVAHDLNNILSGVVSYPELILMDLPVGSPLREPIRVVQKSGEKAAAIVQDLLTLARRGVAATEIVNINRILKEFLRSPEFERLKTFHPNVRFDTDLTLDLLNITGSPVHLSKTMMNLISNAAEAMPGGGRVCLTTSNQYIDRPIRGYDDVQEGDYVTLSVADAGVGISPGDLDRIFEPFYTKKVMGRSGTGLGMAVVWGTVKDHHGYIDVSSEEGRGADFTLYFPATREKRRPDVVQLSFEDYKGQGETVLVVDDVPEQRQIASAMLTRLGYLVQVAGSGEEAVDYLRTREVDLVVLDMIMDPGIDGLETYRRIIETHPGQKAVVASGFSISHRVREIQKLGAGVYIKKPYSIEKIAMAVRTELEK